MCQSIIQVFLPLVASCFRPSIVEFVNCQAVSWELNRCLLGCYPPTAVIRSSKPKGGEGSGMDSSRRPPIRTTTAAHPAIDRRSGDGNSPARSWPPSGSRHVRCKEMMRRDLANMALLVRLLLHRTFFWKMMAMCVRQRLGQ